MITLYSIGHSNHPFEYFAALLQQHEIAVVADVRSTPYSRFNPQYNREALERGLREKNVEYLFLGAELGARREEDECFVDGQVEYPLVWGTPSFQAGVRRLLEEAGRRRVAMMCAEKDPVTCHRAMLIARYLRGESVEIEHIQADGRIETQHAFESRLLALFDLPPEDLFRGRDDMLEEAYGLQSRRIAYSRHE